MRSSDVFGASDAYTVGLLLADARLPSGGHVSSSGLEPALLAGLDRGEVADFMLDRAASAAAVDAGAAVVVRHLLLEAAADGDTAADRAERRAGSIRSLVQAWAARTPGAAARQISYELGRGLHRLCHTLWPGAETLTGLDLPAPRPVVLGAIAAHTGISAEELARLVVYDDAASAAAALLKLDPGDPAEAMSMAMDACASLEHRIADLASLTDPTEIPCASAPLSEGWTERHAQNPRRLFRA